jgi:dTDP-4-dehydrorhamnose 3,5-epimerase
VVVDLRRGSPTCGRWFGLELSEDNFRQLLVPKGFAHGYQCLTDTTEFLYKVDAPYAPEADRGIAWDDPGLAIGWPVPAPILSGKDERWPGMAGFESPFAFQD